MKLASRNILAQGGTMGARISCLLLLGAVASSPLQAEVKFLPPVPDSYLAMEKEMDEAFLKHNVRAWFPRSVDSENGGFYCNFDRAWNKGIDQPKTIVFQSRLTWLASQLAARRPELTGELARVARHGADFLSKNLWDQQYGGFYWSLDPKTQEGRPDQDKHAYGTAFGIYALASAGHALKEKKYTDKAVEAFRWLDKHAHDAQNGGYFESFSRDGTPLPVGSPGEDPIKRDLIFTPSGCKSMNTHIHLLEAFTALYEVWQDPTLKARMEELLDLLLEKVCVWPGAQFMFFTPDWKPLPTAMSFGHDVETAYLLLEAAKVLDEPDSPKVWKTAKALVDHSLRYGWDKTNGGFYDEGSALSKAGGHEQIKTWWVQAEGMNTLLLMHERYGKETDQYWSRFQEQWEFIRKFQMDGFYGGWYARVSDEGTIPDKDSYATRKAGEWKCGYHDGRAMLNVMERLDRLASKRKSG